MNKFTKILNIVKICFPRTFRIGIKQFSKDLEVLHIIPDLPKIKLCFIHRLNDLKNVKFKYFLKKNSCYLTYEN